ncbi:MAG: FtsH protease activity modulator HflK [Candidatus Omnitrophica bacterium]|nr:FtsH protease activity modulator HflK [Candidatus Omnitrophota bacterium]
MDIRTPDDIINPRRHPLDFTHYFVPLFFVLFLISTILGSVYSVGTDELAVVRRFGKFVDITKPGLHLKLPYGIDNARLVPVTFIDKEEFGFKTLKAGVTTQYSQRSYLDESLMLTGGLNMAVVEWIVQYKIKDPTQYVFHLRYSRKVIRDASEAVMRQVVGDHTINEVLTEGRIEIANSAQEKLQEMLDLYESGIQVVTVKLQDVNPPDQVKPSFNEVNQAKQEREQLINQAWKEYNRQIPRAKGEAERLVREAEGYALDLVNRAQGDAERFVLRWEEYSKARDITRERLYLESMQEVLTGVEQMYVIDSEEKGILPLLHLTGEEGAQ